MDDFYTKYYSQLVGKTVEKLALDTSDQENFYGLVFNDGTIAWISCDEEGNGPGHLDIEPANPQRENK